MIPADLTLETNRVLLRPVTEEDYNDFLRLARQDENMWEYFTFNLGDEKQLRKWMAKAERGHI